MKRLIMLCLALLLNLSSQPSFAATQFKEIAIPDGTEFSVVLSDTISSKIATEGDPVNFKVDEDVVINGMVVIAQGTLVKGSVTNAEKRGRLGKAGKLSIRIESTMTVDNQHIKLRASKGKEGEGKTGTTVALTVLFGPLGLLKHGKDAEIKAGTRIKVMTDEGKTVHTNLAQRMDQIPIHEQNQAPNEPLPEDVETPKPQSQQNSAYPLNGISR